jgi:hypothetical protein
MALRTRQPERRLAERLILAAALSLALFAWGLREIKHTF